MYIDEQLAEGYVIVCGGHSDQHSFLVKNLSLSVQCPICGEVALSVELATDFVMRQSGSGDRAPARAEARAQARSEARVNGTLVGSAA